MNILNITFILFLTSISSSLFANEKACEALLSSYKEIQKRTLTSLTLRERRVVSSISLEVNPSEIYYRVGAFTDPHTKEKKISISCGHMWRIGFIAEAVAAQIVSDGNLRAKYDKAVEGYLRYIALTYMFDHVPKNFADFADFKIPNNKREEYWHLVYFIAENMKASVLYHEFAHHVFSHTTKITATAAESQQLEIDADKWSIRTMLKNDMPPITAVFNFAVLREYNLNELSNEKISSHPATIKRMSSYIESTRNSLKDPQIIAIIKEKQSKTGKSVEDVKQELENVINGFEIYLNEQKYKAINPVEYAIVHMEKNDRKETMQLANYYSKGKHGIQKNLKKARELYCQAAMYSQIDFDYVSIAQANFICGYAYWFISILDKDYEKANYFITKSYDMDFRDAIVNINKLTK